MTGLGSPDGTKFGRGSKTDRHAGLIIVHCLLAERCRKLRKASLGIHILVWECIAEDLLTTSQTQL